ncbi:MAG: cupredoxin domain-containing protein [Oculatellaceae cyanobacterium Prado106]|jgi:uncharacterized cupredoxin-like copper-binding protein|nr:cupredoxin domain-containing protein [Oculatellaceae cyanobacterium Prado106]
MNSLKPIVKRIGTLVGYCCAIAFLWLNLLPSLPTQAASAAQQPATEVQIHLGNPANELVFVPNHLTFQAGKRYSLILDNPSDQKHYFTAKDFADGLWTQKVDAGNVEIKGAIHELEVRPGAIAQWVFIPQRPGTYELRCRIPGHTEAGMAGVLTIEEGVGRREWGVGGKKKGKGKREKGKGFQGEELMNQSVKG